MASLVFRRNLPAQIKRLIPHLLNRSTARTASVSSRFTPFVVSGKNHLQLALYQVHPVVGRSHTVTPVATFDASHPAIQRQGLAVALDDHPAVLTKTMPFFFEKDMVSFSAVVRRELEQQALEQELITLRQEVKRLSTLIREVPRQLLCPITLELMLDPVVAADGHTYEREHIQKWFETHCTSPKTGLVLPNKDLVPNLAIRSLAREYVVKLAEYDAANAE
eukprot:TRINITY_DN2069_c0_g1_i12.p2 TRINITY_DN2069_c0_g1~~TRINITY_DN2069_c0_g1_i12.p2  ORF type:complete len:221 (-),score=38.39 TRINITY_DN2069_c0_g1_i12:1291-1953(-)